MSDELIIKDSPQFDRELPPPGDTIGVCFEVFNLGLQETPYGIKPQLMIYFEIDVRYSAGPFQGKRMLIGTRPYTASLSAKSNLRKDLEAWRGKPFNEYELRGWNIKKIKGSAAILSIVHNDKGFADIAGIRKAVIMQDGKLIPMTAPFSLETDPVYVPGRVQKMIEKQIVNENKETDKIAERGWVDAGKVEGRPPTEKEIEIF